jgi:hypothetical protein
MSYVFWWVPLLIKLHQKKGTVVQPSLGIFGGSMSLDCFGGFLDQITTGKNCTVVWPLVAMSDCFGRFGYLAGSLIKLQITTGKKGTVVWPLVGMSHLKHASPWWSRSLPQAAWPWVISQCP